MANGKVHWLWEWLLSNLAWEGFKYVLPPSVMGMVIADIVVVYRWLYGHPSTILAAAAILGTVVVTTLYVAHENARRLVPILTLGEARSQGLYDIEPNAIGFTVQVLNDERRFDTVAHNVRASLIFRHSLGDVVKISPALWVLSEPGGNRKLTDCVSIGMGEERPLLILFWHSSNIPTFFLTTSRIPIRYSDASRLVLGEWKVDIALQGDNVKHFSKKRLSLGPNRVGMTS
jgi:hypothetical protein